VVEKIYFVCFIIMKDNEKPLSPRFDPDQEGWDKNEQEVLDDIKKKYIESDNYFLKDKEILEDTPHKKPIIEIVKDVRIVFLEIINIIIKKENPIPYVMSNNTNQFSFCIIVIAVGVFLLLFTNILF